MGELAVSPEAGHVLVSLGLGSCIGLALVDRARRRRAGPRRAARRRRQRTASAPRKFADLAVPALRRQLVALGARPPRWRRCWSAARRCSRSAAPASTSARATRPRCARSSRRTGSRRAPPRPAAARGRTIRVDVGRRVDHLQGGGRRGRARSPPLAVPLMASGGMNDVLSDADRRARRGGQGRAGSRGGRRRRRSAARGACATVDFSRPTKFTADQQRRLERAHDAFCRTASARLSAELRVPLELEVINIDQLTWANAHGQVPPNSIAAIIEAAPLGDARAADRRARRWCSARSSCCSAATSRPVKPAAS